MKSRSLLVIAAGIPSEFGNRFETLVHKNSRSEIVTRRSLELSERYTDSYADELYGRLVVKLIERSQSDRRNLLMDVNLILLYLAKDDGSESALFRRFDNETLIVPLKRPDTLSVSPVTKNQLNRAANDLAEEGIRSIRYADGLLSVIAEEVTNRGNKTCLLLPPKNFGSDIRMIFDFMRNAVSNRNAVKDFRKDLGRVSSSLNIRRKDGYRYFVGKRGLGFKRPSHAGLRHGYAPIWGDSDHDSSCVLRGRLRFGAPYDPAFHYDCDIANVTPRIFPSCHGTESFPRSRRHLNIAPNDNVR